MKPVTKEEFESFSPFDRGYAVYMCGSREDQPNIPDEKNPYPDGSHERQRWNDGQLRAVLNAQDSEE